MPQASDDLVERLKEKYKNDQFIVGHGDLQCLCEAYIKEQQIVVAEGFIYLNDVDPDDELNDAIDYLVTEWDYAVL